METLPELGREERIPLELTVRKRRGCRSSASFATCAISGIPGSPMDRVGDSGSWRDPGGDPQVSSAIFDEVYRACANSRGQRFHPRLRIRDRSHACEPGHVADLVTTAVQGPRAARSGGWEISSGRANHKGHTLNSTTSEYHSLHHTTSSNDGSG